MSVYLIAEIGNAHDGSLGILHSYIDVISNIGIDAIKFQTHIADAESSIYEPFRVKFSYEDNNRFDYWKRMEFTRQQWMQIKTHCDQVGVDFISSPFSNCAVDLLEDIGIKKYKIGSGEVNNFLMLEKIAKTGKDIILSSGMSNYSELDETMSFLNKYNNNVSILQCTTKYPTTAEDIGLNVISELKHRYHLPVGLSDHSSSIYPIISAVSLGAQLAEFHIVFDKNMFGPDSSSSLTIKEAKRLVKGVRYIERSLSKPVDKNDNAQYQDLKNIFEKSLAANKNMKKGDLITIDDLEAKKPLGYGVVAKDYNTIIGKRIKRNIKQWEFIKREDILE